MSAERTPGSVSKKRRDCHAVMHVPDAGGARGRAKCKCGWKGPIRRAASQWALVPILYGDAIGHDPKFPQGSKPEEMP